MEELRLKVIDWAQDRGIMEKATPLSQCTKVMKECLELVVADLNNDEAEIKDAVGDILVTLFIEAELLGLKWSSVEEACKDNVDRYRAKAIDILLESNALYYLIEEDVTENVAENISFMISLLNKYSERLGIDSVECLQDAYDVIIKRKGEMVNGVFVKEE